MKLPMLPQKRTVTVYFSCGDNLTTEINGTDEEILQYYIGKQFNLGDGNGGDRMSTALFVNFHDHDINIQRLHVLNDVLRILENNDLSKDKDHPWIPGTVGKALKSLIEDVL